VIATPAGFLQTSPMSAWVFVDNNNPQGPRTSMQYGGDHARRIPDADLASVPEKTD